MPDTPDAAWWTFSVHPDERADPEANRLTDDAGRPLVNPPGEAGRLGLNYPGYLGLDRLLDAQTPSSNVPDERIFIITHQLCELVFKQMTFDLAVIAATLRALLDEPDDERFVARALGSESTEAWRPALTASGRLRHSARAVLPAVMKYLGTGSAGEPLFDTEEFHYFRDHLTPSSGFQTAQLRLIQRALGKGALLEVRVFPGETYGHHYTGCPVGHVALADPLILHGHAEVASPSEEAPTGAVASLDDLAHAVLDRLPQPDPTGPPPPPLRSLHAEDVERAVARFHATLGAQGERSQEAIAAFRGDLERAIASENTRRNTLARARGGAFTLRATAEESPLDTVLARLAATDSALHGPQEDSLLTVHRQMARRHIHDDSGTGGGGMPYLVTSQRYLLPLFPALVAYLDLEESGG